MTPKQLVQRSKRLSYLLRHDPADAGLTLDAAGWVSVDKLLASVKWTRAELDQVVADNNKKRFEYSSDNTQIRASQGHSVDVELGYEARTPPDTLYHGTSKHTLDVILRDGLKKMARHHVHLSADKETALIVGKRRSDAVILSVNTAQMQADGHAFYISTNGVWLTDSVPVSYLTVLWT